MVAYLTPGVYLKASDADRRAIDFLRTDIAAFIGIAERGALHTPVRVNSWAQYQALFGSFIPGGYLAYSVKAFFENGGRTCWIVRVADAGAAQPAALPLLDALGVPTLLVEAGSEGTWGGRLAVRIVHTYSAATQTRAVAQPADGLASTVDSVAGFQVGALVRVYQAGVAPVQGYRTVTRVDAGRSQLGWDSTLTPAFNLAQPLAFETHEFNLSVYWDGRVVETFTRLGFPDGAGCEDNPIVKCNAAKVVNSRSQLIKVTDLASNSPVDQRLPAPLFAALTGGADGLATLTIDDFTGDPSLTAKWGLRTLEDVDEIAIVAMPDIHIQPALPVVFAPQTPAPPDPCLEPPTAPAPPLVLAPPDIPPKFGLDDLYSAQAALIQHCEMQRDRIALVDPPFSQRQGEVDWGEVQAWRQRFDTSYAALYYPWVLVYDPLRLDGQVVRAIPPSGHIAGVYARSDTEIGVHKAPANEVLRWAQGVRVNVQDEMQAILNPLDINAIRPLGGRNLRVYGARTLSSDAAWRYVNVRRLLMLIEEALEESLQWAVFEPNNFTLRQTLILVISSYLRTLWMLGALVGAEEEMAFFVKCDRENNPPELAELGQIVVEVGVAPVKPAEFVVISIGRVDNMFTLTEERGI